MPLPSVPPLPPEAPGPLTGVRVLDLSRVVSGPLCSRLLADLGAEVVKVEPPDGDVSRTVPPAVGGTGAYFTQMNAGKRNVCLDLKAPGAAEVVARLADASDVLLENFRPGVLARLGIDPAALRARNPRLVVCSISGWGQDGPWRTRRAYAPLMHAEVGFIEFAARVRGRRPEQESRQHGDVYPALLAANAILAALLRRATTGEGQHVDVSMAQALVYVDEWAAVNLQHHDGDHGVFETWTHHLFPLGDGSWVAMVGNPTRLFPAFWQALGGDPDVLHDPRFATVHARAEHLDEVLALLDGLFRRVPDDATLEAMLPDGLLTAPMRSTPELAATPWAAHRGLTAEVAPDLHVPAAPFRLEDGAVGVRGPAAGRGADNRAVLRELAGYSEAELDALEAAGAVVPPG